MSIETLIAQYGLVAVFLGAGIEGETAAVVGGVIAQEGLVSLPGAMIAAVTGSFVADQLFFALGRRFRDHPRVRRMAEKPAFARALDTFEAHPVGFIFAFRFLYGLRTVSPIAIGTTQVATRTFLAVNAAAAAVWGALFVTIGFVFGEGFERLLHRLRPDRHQLAIVVGVVLLGALLAWGAVVAGATRMTRFTLTITATDADIDELGHVNNAVWVRWIQQIATAHWDAVAPAEHRAAYIWVVTRHEIDYRGNVKAGETVTAETWVDTPPQGARFDRKVRFLDADARVKVEAVTTWALLDRATGRLLRVRADVAAPFFLSGL